MNFIDELKKNNVDCNEVVWTGKNRNLKHDYIYQLQTSEAQETYQKLQKFLQDRIR